MKVEEYFEMYTGGNSNTLSWTPKAIMEFAEDYHNKQLRLLSVVKSVKGKEEITFQDWLKQKGYTKLL